MRINKLLFLLFLLPAVLMSVTACSDDKDDESEFSDWKNRNDAYQQPGTGHLWQRVGSQLPVAHLSELFAGRNH